MTPVVSTLRSRSLRNVLLIAKISAAKMPVAKMLAATALVTMMLVSPVSAVGVTPELLLNSDREPQNGLINHCTYDGQRFSLLDRISRNNVKNLKIAYGAPSGGGTGNEFTNATSDGTIVAHDDTSLDVGTLKNQRNAPGAIRVQGMR